MQNNPTLDNNYNIQKLIDDDEFSKSYLVTNKNDNNQYIAKVSKPNLDGPYNFEHDLQMTTVASGLNNPNIIHLNGHGVGILKDGEKVINDAKYMIFENCPRGELFNYILSGRLTEKHAKFIFKKILLGVQALHGAGYCHRDLKL